MLNFRLPIFLIMICSLFAVTACDQSNHQSSPVRQNAQKDMARAKFTEALLNLEPLKQQVVLCYNENGFKENVQPECSSGNKGTVYRIPESFSTTYFESIVVEDGSIIATAKKINGLNGETYILDPYVEGTGIRWQLAPDSTCIKAGFC